MLLSVVQASCGSVRARLVWSVSLLFRVKREILYKSSDLVQFGKSECRGSPDRREIFGQTEKLLEERLGQDLEEKVGKVRGNERWQPERKTGTTDR